MFNKSQIGIFVIFSVMIVVGSIWIYKISFDDKINDLKVDNFKSDLDETSIKNYVQNCLDESSKLGVFYLANNGGFIYNYSYVLYSENKYIAYSYYNKSYSAPDEEYMKEELAKFIEDTTYLCVKNYPNDEYKFSLIKPNAKIDIYDKGIDISLEFPITLENNNGKSKEISKYGYFLPVRFGHILEIRNELILKIQKNGNLNFEDLLNYDVEINQIPVDKNDLIYTIYDSESNINDVPFIFNFAVKSFDNTPPEIEDIPNFVLNLNEEFKYNITAQDFDDDELVFYSKSTKLNIDSKTGEFSFTPDNKGNYNLDICVKDSHGGEDCEKVSFLVK